jgi:glycosyltransferase involved in cell wall biosynthesis
MYLDQTRNDYSLSIVIPTFNEAGSIEYVLNELLAYTRKNHCKIIIVDDGSTDSTPEILTRIALSNPTLPLKVITHTQNRGYGGALKSGILGADTDLVVTIDADGQHNLEDFEGL